MEFTKVNIKIENDKPNFIIEEKEVSKIQIIMPFFYDSISTSLTEENGKLFLHTFDQIAGSCVGNKNYIQHFYSLNPYTKTVKIIVPKNSIEHLNVSLENGNIFLKKIHIEKANISSVRGNIQILDSNIHTTSINGWESDAYIKNLEGTSCSVLTKTGDLVLEGNTPDITTLKTNTGDIKVISDDYGVRYTLFDIHSKYIEQAVTPAKEAQKIIRCVAPYGNINVNVLSEIFPK